MQFVLIFGNQLSPSQVQPSIKSDRCISATKRKWKWKWTIHWLQKKKKKNKHRQNENRYIQSIFIKIGHWKRLEHLSIRTLFRLRRYHKWNHMHTNCKKKPAETKSICPNETNRFAIAWVRKSQMIAERAHTQTHTRAVIQCTTITIIILFRVGLCLTSLSSFCLII